MRIVGGELRGRRLVAPRDERTRPMLEKARAAVFNVLGDRVAGARVLDLCSGTGSLGLEALSRGASEAILVERDPVSLSCLVRNLESLGVGDRASIRRGRWEDVAAGMSASSCDLVLLDPPYGEMEDPIRRGRLLEIARDLVRRVLTPGGKLVLHFPSDAVDDDAFSAFPGADLRRYGRNGVAFIPRLA